MIPTITHAHFPKDRTLVETLFREYQEGLGVNLDFQNFADEMAKLPGKYAPPEGGIAIARIGKKPVGCVAWYPLAPGICELKRLYVRPDCRGHKLGKRLLEHAINAARKSGYAKLRLDSLARLKEAAKLYESFAFTPIAPYNTNPHGDVYYLEFDLTTPCEPTTKKTPTPA